MLIRSCIIHLLPLRRLTTPIQTKIRNLICSIHLRTHLLVPPITNNSNGVITTLGIRPNTLPLRMFILLMHMDMGMDMDMLHQHH